MAGRPSKYNQVIAGNILKRFATGETLSNICKPDRMPSRMTVFTWRSVHPEFAKAYESATESHTEALLDTLRTIVMGCDDKSAKSAKVKADYITWFCGKLNRKYSDRIQVDITQTVDISPALSLAVERMELLGVGLPPLIEAECSQE